MEESTTQSERLRLTRIYAGYDARHASSRTWSLGNPGYAYLEELRCRALAALLDAEGLSDLGGLTILDVGCGSGRELRRLCELGAEPRRCHGIDLLRDRIDAARQASPEMHLCCADAGRLPYTDASFDLVMANMVFGSILDDGIAAAVAAEMRRVVRPTGAIIWHEQRLPNPTNPHVRAYSLADVRRFFPGFAPRVARIAPLPPLVRAVGIIAPRLLPLLGALPLPRTQNLVVLRLAS